MESSDDETLSFVNKGYTADDIVEQLAKLDEAGIEYYLVYMTGLAGKGYGQRNALNTAETLNKISPHFVKNPRFLSIDSLTLFPNTGLYEIYVTMLIKPYCAPAFAPVITSQTFK